MARRVIQLAILYAMVLVLAPTDADGAAVSRGQVSAPSQASASSHSMASGAGSRHGGETRSVAHSA